MTTPSPPDHFISTQHARKTDHDITRSLKSIIQPSFPHYLPSWLQNLMVHRAKNADTTIVYPADAILAIDADTAIIYPADKSAKNADTAIIYLADKRAKDDETAIVYHKKRVLLPKK